MPPKDIAYRNRLLARQTASNRVAMVEVLLKARTRIENKILRAAKDKKFATVRRYREGIYKDIQMEYVRLQGDLDVWTKGSILRTSKVYHALAAEDLKLTDEDKKIISFTKFSKKHNEDYFNRIHPFNAERLAAVNVSLNPKLAQMATSDVRALQSAVVDSFREAQVAGLTSSERWKILQGKVLDYADNPATWAFIDKAGRKWERGSYFNMLNRTVSANVARESYNDTLIDEGRDLVQIIGGLSANSRDACELWVGRVVSLTGETSGFPTVQQYKDAGGFGPNCVHTTVYVSDKFERTAQLIDEQRGLPAPHAGKSRKNPVVKMKNSDMPKGWTPKPAKPPSTYKPVKTREEGEEWVRTNILEKPYEKQEWIDRRTGKVVKTEQISNVSYKGLSVESVNEINSALALSKDRGLPVPRKIFAKNFRKQDFNMAMRGGTLEINTKYMKSPSEARKRHKQVQESLEMLKKEMPNLRALDKAGKLDRRGKALLSRGEEMAKYQRTHVGDGSPKDVATHELGHFLSGGGLPNQTTEERRAWFKIKNEAISEQISPDYRYKLSYYPEESKFLGQTPEEFFAESYVAYVKGEGAKTLSPKMIKLLDGVSR